MGTRALRAALCSGPVLWPSALGVGSPQGSLVTPARPAIPGSERQGSAPSFQTQRVPTPTATGTGVPPGETRAQARGTREGAANLALPADQSQSRLA